MLLLLFLVFPMLVFGVSNSITYTDKSAAEQTNRSFFQLRHFGNGELCDYPQPLVNGTPASFWQANVKTRWPGVPACPGGYVKDAYIGWEATITASGSITVEFRNTTASSSGGSAMTKQQMLDFDTGGGTGSWGQKIRLTASSVNQDASCRTMLNDNHYRVLHDGPIVTEILVREDPQSVAGGTTRTTSVGFECTANCSTSPFDLASATWADPGANVQFDSIRPSFVVRFYRRWNRVEIDSLIENSWLDRRQDLRFALTIFEGNAETTQWFTSGANTAFFGPGMWHWETRWAPSAPASTKIDLNRDYLIHSKVMPNTDAVIGSAAITLESNAFTATDQGAFLNGTGPHMGWGQITRGMNSGGSRGELGLFSRWDVRYLLTFEPSLLDAVIGNARALAHAMTHRMTEGATGKFYDSGGTVEAFGKFFSRDARPTMYTGPASDAPAAGDATTEVGVVHGPVAAACGADLCSNYSGSNTGNVWQLDMHHTPSAGFVAYLATGKYVYLELMQAYASWGLGLGHNAGPNVMNLTNISRRDKAIMMQNNSPRFHAWQLRNVTHAAAMSWDGTPEASYFREKLTNNLQAWEGKFDIQNGSATLPGTTGCGDYVEASETNLWKLWKCGYEQGFANPLGFADKGSTDSATQALGLQSSQAGRWTSRWMHHFLQTVLGHMRDIGFTQWNRVHEKVSAMAIARISDSTVNPYASFEYQVATRNSGDTAYKTTWADVEDDNLRTGILVGDITSGATTLQVAGSDGTGNIARWITHDSSIQIDSEEMLVTSVSGNTVKTISSVNTTTEELTITSHGLTGGQRTLYFNTGTQITGLTHLTVYTVLVVDANTVKLSSNGADPIDLQSTSSNASLRTITLTVTRAAFGTTAASHNAGATITRLLKAIPLSQDQEPEGGYAWFMRSALALATDYSVTVTDLGDSSTLTAGGAYNWLNGTMGYLTRGGNNTSNCGSLTVSQCDNPMWAWIPRVPASKHRQSGGAVSSGGMRVQ